MATVGGHDSLDWFVAAENAKVNWLNAWGNYLKAEGEARLANAQAQSEEARAQMLRDIETQFKLELKRLNRDRHDLDKAIGYLKQQMDTAAQLYEGAEGFPSYTEFWRSVDEARGIVKLGIPPATWKTIDGTVDAQDLQNMHSVSVSTKRPASFVGTNISESLEKLKHLGWCPRFGTKTHSRVCAMLDAFGTVAKGQYVEMQQQIANKKFDPSVIIPFISSK